MPRKKVYGKRSQARCDAFTSLVSPQQHTPKDAGRSQAAEVTEEVSRLAIGDNVEKQTSIRRMGALAEVNPNITGLPLALSVDKGTARPRSRRTVLVEDDEDRNTARARKQAVAAPREVKGVERQTPQSEPGAEDGPISLRNDYTRQSPNGKTEILKKDEEEPSHGKTEQEELLEHLGNHCVGTSSILPPAFTTHHEYCARLLELSSHSMTHFSAWSDQLSNLFSISKIAEASFGEVYRLSLSDQLSGFSSHDESVFKIIPLRAPGNALPQAERARDESMSEPDDVANEVKLLQRMSSIPGFTNFRDVRVVQGRPPQPFIDAYKAFDVVHKAKRKEPSNFPDPSKEASYADDQLWAVIEMQDAGMDLERLVEASVCTSVWYVWDVFWQVVLSIAKGEEGAQFEHRDLHLGNICVRRLSQQSSAVDVKRKLNFMDLETTVIDYTISRALMADDTIAFHDLSRDAGLFEGDSTDEYQYDIYRYMRGAFLTDDPYADISQQTKQSESSWEQYHPVTNLIWLHFVLHKLLEQLKWPSSKKAPARKRKAEYSEWKRSTELEKALLRVQDLLDPGEVCQNETRSASDLVGLALREGWLNVEDVVGADPAESGLDDVFEKLELRAHGEDEASEDTAKTGLTPVKKVPRTRRKK